MDRFNDGGREHVPTFKETQAEQLLEQREADESLSKEFSTRFPNVRECVRNSTDKIIYCGRCSAPMKGRKCSDDGCSSRFHH